MKWIQGMRESVREDAEEGDKREHKADGSRERTARILGSKKKRRKGSD